MQEKKLVKVVTETSSRLAEAKSQVAGSLDTTSTKSQLKNLTRPGSPSSAMRKAGVALIVVTPDPVTAVPGVALIAASYAYKKKEPTNLSDLAAETRKMLRDIRDLSL